MRFVSIRQMPITQKMLLALSTLFLALMAVHAVSSAWLLESVVHRQVKDELENAATSLVDMVTITVDASIKSYLRGIAEKNLDLVASIHRQVADGRLSDAEAREKATSLLLDQPIGKTGYIYVLDGQGVIRVHPRPLLRGADLTQYDFIRKQLALHSGYLEYDWANPGESTAKPKALYMAYFAPWDWIISVSSYRDEFRDLVNVNDIREKFLGLHFGETGYPFILRTDGTLIVHPVLEQTNIADSRDASGRYFVREILERRNGQIVYAWKNPGEPDAREKLTVFRYLPEMDWIVATSSYMEGFKRARAVFAWTTAGSLLLSALLIGFVTLWIERRVIRPLGALAARVASSSGGDDSTPARGGNEVELLTRAFDDFLERIEEGRLRILESEHRYRGIFENAVEGIFQTNAQGRFLSANPSLAKILGYDAAEELVDSVADIGRQVYADAAQRREIWRLLAEKGVVHGFETRLMKKDGSLIWASISARTVEQDGKIASVAGFLTDITQERQARKELAEYRDHLEELVEQRTAELMESKEQAEAATRAKSVFLANMSHELRTPLNAVIGYSQIMAKSLTDPTMMSNMERILRAGEHLLSLINDVLSISRIEAGRLVLQPEPFETSSFFSVIEGIVRERSEAKRLTFVMEIPVEFPRALMGDVRKLRQILVNLLTNAVKFTDQGQIVLRVSRSGTDTRFEIEDTGIGIGSADLRRIFQPFEQVAQEKRGSEGTGLGLHISQTMVQLMGGCLGVDSTPGKGSRFHFTIPLPEAELPSTIRFDIPEIPVLADHQAMVRVLVVDDVDDNRELLSLVFSSAGMEVRAARSGQEGLDIWEAWSPHVVWMDLRMPEMDGWEAARRLRVREAEIGRARTLLVAITASAIDLDTDELERAEFDAWVVKPINISELFSKLETLLGLRFNARVAIPAPPELPDRDGLQSPGASWVQAFGEALRLGDSEGMWELLAKLGDGPVARSLRPLIREYRYEELSRVLDEWGSHARA